MYSERCTGSRIEIPCATTTHFPWKKKRFLILAESISCKFGVNWPQTHTYTHFQVIGLIVVRRLSVRHRRCAISRQSGEFGINIVVLELNCLWLYNLIWLHHVSFIIRLHCPMLVAHRGNSVSHCEGQWNYRYFVGWHRADKLYYAYCYIHVRSTFYSNELCVEYIRQLVLVHYRRSKNGLCQTANIGISQSPWERNRSQK